MYTLHFKPLVSRANAEHLCSLQLWVNVNGKRATISLPIKVNALTFDKDISSKKTNPLQRYIVSIRAKLDDYYLSHPHCTSAEIVEYVRNDFKEKSYDLSTLCKEYLSVLSKKENVGEITYSTFKKYKLTFKRLIDCISNKAVSDVTAADIMQFQLSMQKNIDNNVVVGYMCRTKALFNYAIDAERISTNPVRSKLRKITKEIIPLTTDELERIEKVEIENKSLERIRDMFLLSCYTGLAYADLMKLKKSDIKEKDGVKYIEKERQKTKIKFFIPLIDKALNILDKYDEIPNISNQKLNLYLKTLGMMCNIEKNMHMHLARHTALTNFLNIYHLSLEVVQKIAGHSSVIMTQHYSKLSNDRMIEAVQKIY